MTSNNQLYNLLTEAISQPDSNILRVKENVGQDPTQLLKNSLESADINNKALQENYWLYDKPTMLYSFLNPVLDDLLKQHEAFEFRNPVDAVELKIPDYYDIIKNPMDLSTIRTKLHSGQYQNGWEFVEDVWLMFSNAWLYNKKTTRVYKDCSKLAGLFRDIIDRPMKNLGYCCGQQYTFDPKVLFCISKQDCIIPKFAPYWNYNDRYHLCKKCYLGISSSTVVFQNSTETITLNKEEFVLKFNDKVTKEKFIGCFNCGIKWHKICALYLEDIWKDGFLCKNCMINLRKFRIPNKFTAENLQQNKLDFHIEERVHNFLKKEGCNSKVIIRLVNNAKKSFFVQKDAKSKFVSTGIWPEQFPYTSKTLLAFQKVENKDICFFSMFVQEYDSKCPQPNTRRVYLSYIDSIHFFTPKELRTCVFHEILLGYLDYVRNLGFAKVHLWACPPKEGEDYVFFCHPKEQKTPSTKKLLNWYKVILDKAIQEKIVKDYKDIYVQAIEDNLKDVSELPYFEGDFLPITIEKEISKIEGSVENKVSCRSMTKAALSVINEQKEKVIDKSKEKSLTTKHKKGKKNLKIIKNVSSYSVGDPLTDRIIFFLQHHKEAFLVIHLDQNLTTPELLEIVDPDPVIQSGLMCSREPFLEFCKDNDHEFSSIRRAKYSTMVLLYELHKENADTFYCNHCRIILEAGFHCTICKDFDLCSDCYNLHGHDHEMEDLKLNLESNSYTTYPDRIMGNALALDHVSICNDANCRFSRCSEVKYLIKHFEACGKRRKDCQFCLSLFPAICKHSKSCQNCNCRIYPCKNKKRYDWNLSQKVENKQFCVISAATEEKICNNSTLCRLQNIYDQKKENQSSAIPEAAKILPTYKNHHSSTYISIPNDRIATNHLSFANSLQKSSIANCRNWTTDISANSDKNTKVENGSESISETYVGCPNHYKATEVTPCKTELKTCHMQNFIISNNGIVSDFTKNSSQPKNFNIKTEVTTNIPFNKQHPLTYKVNDNGINSREFLSASRLHIFNNTVSNIYQNSSNIIHPKSESIYNFGENMTSSLYHNVDHSSKTMQNSNCVSIRSLKRKLLPDVSEQVSKSAFHLDQMPFNVQNPNSYISSHIVKSNENLISSVPDIFSSQVEELSNEIIANQQFHTIKFPKVQVYSDKNSETYSITDNSTSKLQTFDCDSIPNLQKQSNEVLVNNRIPLSIHHAEGLNYVKDIKPNSNGEKEHVSSNIQTFDSYHFTSILSGKSSQTLPLNVATNSFSAPVYPKAELNAEIEVNKSSFITTNCSKTVLTPDMHCSLTPSSNLSMPCNSSVSIRSVENLEGPDTFTQENSYKIINNKQNIGLPQLLKFKILKYSKKLNKVYLAPVPPANSDKYNASFKKNIEYLIPNAFKEISKLVNLKQRNSEISDIKKNSMEGNCSKLISNKKRKIILTSNKSPPNILISSKSKGSSTVNKCHPSHINSLNAFEYIRYENHKNGLTPDGLAFRPDFHSPVITNTPECMYPISDLTSNSPSEYSARQQVPFSVDYCKILNSEEENKPVISSVNAHLASDYLKNKTEFASSLEQNEVPVVLNQVYSQQEKSAEEVSYVCSESISKNFQTNTSGNNVIDAAPFTEDKNTCFFTNNYSVYQPLNFNAEKKHCSESFVPKNNYSSQYKKTLPGFESFSRNSDFTSLKNKSLSFSRNNIHASENSQEQMCILPSQSVSLMTLKNELPPFHVPNYCTVSMTSNTPSMHSASGTTASSSTSTERVRNEELREISTFEEPNNVFLFTGHRNKNTSYVANSSIEKPFMAVTPIHNLHTFSANSQNSVPNNNHQNSAINNIHCETLYKANEITLQNTSASIEPTYMLDINKNKVSCLTSDYSNNILFPIFERDDVIKQEPSTIPNVSKHVSFGTAESFYSTNSLNGTQVSSYSSKLPSLHSFDLKNSIHECNVLDNSYENMSSSYEAQENYVSNVSKPRDCKESYILGDIPNTGSYFIGNASYTDSEAQLSFKKESAVFREAASQIKHQQCIGIASTLSNNGVFQRKSLIKQGALKKGQAIKKIPFNKRGRKKAGNKL